MKNIKDKLTTLCGVIIAVCGVLTGLSQSGIVLSSGVQTGSIIAGSLAGGIIAFFTGKNSDGSTKLPEQLTSNQALSGTNTTGK